MGRKTILTPELQDIITSAVARGNFLQTAARLARVSDASLMTWMDKGRQGLEPYAAFLEAVEHAEADSEQAMVAHVIDASGHDPRNAQWHLERRWAGKRWQQRKELQIDGEVVQKRLVLSDEEDEGSTQAEEDSPVQGDTPTHTGAGE